MGCTPRPRHVRCLDAILLIVPIIWPDSEQYEQWMALRKKNYRKLWGFWWFCFFTARHDSTRTPFAAAEWKKPCFLLAFLGVSWFSCKFSHHPRLQRLPRLPFGRGEEFWEALSQRFCPKIRVSTKDDWKIWPWTMELYGIMGACNF